MKLKSMPKNLFKPRKVVLVLFAGMLILSSCATNRWGRRCSFCSTNLMPYTTVQNLNNAKGE